MAIRAAVFDMDGTIYDSRIDFLELRRRIGLERDGRPILTQLREAPAAVRRRGMALLEQAEADGARDGSLVPGTKELLGLLRRAGVACALVTNNSRASVDEVLRKHPIRFDVIITRDDGPSKPEPDAFRAALSHLGVRADEAIVIGDAHLDLIAAHRAGIPRVILVGTASWMRDYIPDDLPHETAPDLRSAVGIVERMIIAEGGG